MDNVPSVDTVFRALLEHLGDGVCIFTGESRLFVNQEFVNQMDLDSIEAATSATARFIYYHPDDRPKWLAMSDRWDEISPYRYFTPDGIDGRKVLEATFSKVVFDGAPAWAAVVRDVTEAAENARASEAREQLYRKLFESAPVGIALTGPGREVIAANPALVAMLGKPMEEIVGEPLRAFERLPYGRRNEGHREQLESGSVDIVRTTREFVRADGSILPADVTTSALRDDEGRFSFAIRVVHDNTKAQQLGIAEARFHRLFEDVPVGIAIVDRDHLIIEANEVLCRMFGRTTSEIVGNRLSAFLRDRTGRGMHEFEHLITGEIDSFSMDREFVHSDGKSVWTETITSAVRDERGRFQYAVRVINDITERIAAEKARGEFIAMTSHELRTPLTAIHAAVALLADGINDSSPATGHSLATVAEQNSSRMTTSRGRSAGHAAIVPWHVYFGSGPVRCAAGRTRGRGSSGFGCRYETDHREIGSRRRGAGRRPGTGFADSDEPSNHRR